MVEPGVNHFEFLQKKREVTTDYLGRFSVAGNDLSSHRNKFYSLADAVDTANSAFSKRGVDIFVYDSRGRVVHIADYPDYTIN